MITRAQVRAFAPIAVAWMGLVACRVLARLISVGSGARGPLGLTMLTATVNAYWLIAGPLLASFRRASPARWTRGRAILGIVVATVVVLLAEPVWYRAALIAFNGDPLEWWAAVIFRGDVNGLVVAIILAAGWLGDGFNRAVVRQRQRGELEAVLVDAELRALALQLQPHFLFNTLQLAAEAAYDDIGEAKRVVHDLQTLLRRTFEFEERSLVRVSEEIDFLQSYIAIQQSRFGSRLHVDVDVDSRANDLLLPPLLLQPLVENSIQHGIGPLARDGRIVVRIACDVDRLRIEVRDNGIGFAATNRARSTAGLGFGVTRRRLQSLFAGNHSLETGDAIGGGASVTICLPTLEASSRAEGRGFMVEDRTTQLTFDSRPSALQTGPSTLNPRPSTLNPPSTLEPQFLPLGRHWWSGRAAFAIAGGSALMLVNVVGSAYMVERSSGPTSLPAARFVVWIPVQLLAFALGLMLWRARDVRRWLQRRDAETRALRLRIDEARARVAALRSGKDLMHSALDRLTQARDPQEFDELTLTSAEMVRSLLALAKDGQHSADVEAELVKRYVTLFAPI